MEALTVLTICCWVQGIVGIVGIVWVSPMFIQIIKEFCTQEQHDV